MHQKKKKKKTQTINHLREHATNAVAGVRLSLCSCVFFSSGGNTFKSFKDTSRYDEHLRFF